MPIENVRSILIIGLCVVLFLLWQAWQRDYGLKRPITVPAPTTTTAPDAPSVQAPEQPTGAEAPVAAPDTPGTVTPVVKGDRVRIQTDLLTLEMDQTGKQIFSLELLDYPVAVEQPDVPFRLFLDTPGDIFTAETGLLGSGEQPNAESRFVPAQTDYVMEDGQDKLEVRFNWAGDTGIKVRKVYTFTRDSYEVPITYEVENTSDEPWSGRVYGQFRRKPPVPEGGLFRTYTYTGGVLSSPEKPYEKIDFDDMLEKPLDKSYPGGWMAMIQHYFAAAFVPNTDATANYYTKALPEGQYLIGVYADQVVQPGETAELTLTAYAGPKIQKLLEEVAPGLERTVDYGWLFFIAQPLFWLLSWIHGVIGNWGWSIIVLTCLIKLAFFHLSATSYKSMARMRKLTPRMQQLRERYGSDKQRMNQALMELYKKEKVNPLGGCLPIVVQIPVFISLYWVLLESVELRQASWILWYNDLSQYDPFFVLPVLMGVSMLAQQKLNPAPPDPMQAKIMMALPFVFTFFFLFFPSGLVLYWFVNNLLSITQQYVITKRIEASKD